MANERIMLSKTYSTTTAISFPVAVYEKLDGVPAIITNDNGIITALSRQGEEILSIDHIRSYLANKLPVGASIVGELYIAGEPFKRISGLVRRKESTSETEALRLYIWDYLPAGEPYGTFHYRMSVFGIRFEDILLPEDDAPDDQLVHSIPGKHCATSGDFDAYMETFWAENWQAEGVVIRQLFGPESVWKPGWRSPGMVKLKATRTVDLEVVGFEEALDVKTKEPKGMVGRINVRYHTGASSDGKNEYTDFVVIGAGPGKLSHAERVHIWENQKEYIGKIAEIAYMPDDSYDALREARFHRWREDKTTPSQEG